LSASLSIEIVAQPFERIAADLAIAGFFSDERPLRGPAGRADWRLCGAVSKLIEQNRLKGNLDDALLMPSSDRLYAPRVLLIGLGRRSRFDLRAARRATREAVGRALDLRAERVALPPLGIAVDDFPRHAAVVMEGALEAVAASDRDDARLCLRLGFEVGQVRVAREALSAAAETRGVPEVGLELPVRERPAAAGAAL
jgi:hypothetical protein